MTEIDGDAPEPATGTPDPDGETGAATDARLRADVERLTDQWRRALADLDNLRKRAARESASARADERARVAAEWLPVLDNLDLALEHAGRSRHDRRGCRGGPGAGAGGAGAARLPAPGRRRHPVRPGPARGGGGALDPDAAPGTVLQVVRPGYGEGDRQLRPAAVVVATGAG